MSDITAVTVIPNITLFTEYNVAEFNYLTKPIHFTDQM